MGKIILKIVLSIVIGFSLLRFGYEFKNDWLSIITQSLGYIVISYPFILFFKVFINQIKFTIEQKKIDKKFYSQKGVVYGKFTIEGKPLTPTKVVVKNSDGSNHDWTYRWISYVDKNGYYEVKFLSDGIFICEFSHTFLNGNTLVEKREFKIENGLQVMINIDIKK